MNKKIALSSAVLSLLLIAGFVTAGSALAQTQTQSARGNWQGGGMRGNRQPGVFGTVASVSGTTLTITSKGRPTGTSATATTTTYTVDASSATVTKNNTASTVSAIAVGDTVMVQGTVSGTNVTARTIRDGITPNNNDKNPTPNPIIQGNGQPVVAGSVTAVSGNTITITNKSSVTYTVDATNAKIVKGNTASTIAGIANGDNVVVQGTVNGTSITATSVIDQTKVAGPSGSTTQKSRGDFMGSFVGGISSFFRKLFGF